MWGLALSKARRQLNCLCDLARLCYDSALQVAGWLALAGAVLDKRER